MKHTFPLFLLLLICTLSACRKEEPQTLPKPCTGVTINKTLLVPTWSWTQNNLSSSIYPVVYDQQVVFSRHLAGEQTELLSFDGVSGQLLWQSILPAYLFDRNYRQIGSKLYFVGNPQTTLLCFDMATQQLETVWTLPTPGFVLSQFATQSGFAICTGRNYKQDIDSLEFSAYLINLQNGESHEVLRFQTRDGWGNEGILDPQVTVVPSGDTMFCFVTSEYIPEFVSHFFTLNISTGASTQSSALPDSYGSERGNLVVEGNRAWLLAGKKLQCIEVSTGTILWQTDNFYPDSYRLLIRQNKALVMSRTGEMYAFNANTGTLLWRQYNSGYIEDISSSFIQEGRLFLPQDLHLRSIDLETGCITDDHALSPGNGDGVYQMIATPDNQRVYMVNFKGSMQNFFAVPVPK